MASTESRVAPPRPRFTSVAVAAAFAFAVTVGGGFQFGFATGYVPVCLQYFSYVKNCTRYEGEGACAAVAGCEWIQGMPPGATPSINRTATEFSANSQVRATLHPSSANATSSGSCLFADRNPHAPPCDALADEPTCTSGVQTECEWNPARRACQHAAGWTPVQEGLLASAMIFGAMLGSLVAAPIVGRLGLRRTMIVAGSIVLVMSGVQTAAWNEDLYGLLTAARVALGLGIGLGSVASPLYCGVVAPPHLRGVIGVCYQIAITAGIFVSAMLGLAISPVNDGLRGDAQLVRRFHVLNAFSMLTGLAYAFIGRVAPQPESVVLENDEKTRSDGCADDGVITPINNHDATSVNVYDNAHAERAPLLPAASAVDKTTDGGAQEEEEEASGQGNKGAVLRSFAAAGLMAVALQFTGMNAIVNYAPTLAASAGLEPLVGNAVIMTWNFVAGLAAVPLASRAPNPAKTFAVGTLIASCACFLVGITAFPGVVASVVARHACMWIGVLVFIGLYETAIGPPFYPLAQAVFPAAYRDAGCSFAVTAQFAFNVAVNFGFPVCVQALSGGPNGDQHKGQAIMFITFGSVGLVAVALLHRIRH